MKIARSLLPALMVALLGVVAMARVQFQPTDFAVGDFRDRQGRSTPRQAPRPSPRTGRRFPISPAVPPLGTARLPHGWHSETFHA